VTCPIHGAQFDVCTGAVLRGPAKDPLKTYRVIVAGDIGRVEADAAAVAKTTSQVE
jgi:nitrite reductase/ring-hydroxylating ferredoxin subunit